MATSTQTSTCSGASLVCLVEDDIPGAQLPRSTPEECSVTQLKHWLLCRAASTTGRKQQIVSRVKAYINSGLAAKNLRDPDGGIHLARRKTQLSILEVVEPDVKTSFPNEGFSENLEGLPEVNFKTIWTYMVACLDAKKQLSTAKSLVQGYNFYQSGHV